jgi:4-amino-4-deoxy-L-arabinose transferase-like glycosyltransferase
MVTSAEPKSSTGSGVYSKRLLLWLVILAASAVYLACIISPPSLMDDVDAVQAQIARNMVHSGDWVTARLDGVPYLEKSPMIYWLIAIFYRMLGETDWVARLPVALSAIGLAWLTAAFGMWAFGRKAGLYAGLVISTCAGLFLFTRILIPDVMLTATITLSMWAFLRLMDETEPRPRFWSTALAVSLGSGLLLKSLIAVVFPVAAALIYLLLTGQIRHAKVWRRLRPVSGLVIVLLVAAPWHIMAALRNPPFFDLQLHAGVPLGPGQYHGFTWFYFINEQLLRFLNLRYPRDYNTVPRIYFWLFHLLWLFPWSVYLPAVARLSFRPLNRAGRARLLALCWTGFLLVFFTFSTTQEYYSMPCYPALALLIGSAIAAGGRWIERGTRLLSIVAAVAAVVTLGLCFVVRNVPAPGDISRALSQNPGAYTLSLGHMEDLTLPSLAYLRLPLALAGIAFLIGALGMLRTRGERPYLAITLMMVIFFQAARVAMVAFDPYLSSRPLAEALNAAPSGDLIVDHHYYDFSSVFFYSNRGALLLNGRRQNLIYGSYAPGAPDVFIDDAQWKSLWQSPRRYYLVADESQRSRFEHLGGPAALHVVAESGGKMLLTNTPW